MLGQTSHTRHGFLDLLLAFKRERNSHNTYRQNTHFLRHFGYYS